MKNILIIALSIFSFSAFAASGAGANNGLNGDLIQNVSASGLSIEQATQGVATGHITSGSTAELER
ncbi:hypothetical protein [Enterovibrio calviensis]|uniref:hypothetical protein n=1 Tax=Enterovibrio calviensis TaxID=91359 RepID=UPI00048380A1|nr:hypothetical protein [Enterovibrio calviensis]